MSRRRWRYLAIAAALIGANAAAQTEPTGIRATKHNFQLATNKVRVADGATEDGICVFCHTPHKANASLLLWNHTMSANDYKWSDVSGGKTTGGTAYPTNLKTWSGSTAK